MIPGVQVTLVIGGAITVLIACFIADLLNHIVRQLTRMNDLKEKAQQPIQVKTPDQISKEQIEDFKKKWNAMYGKFPQDWKYQFEPPRSEDEIALERAINAGSITGGDPMSGIGFPTTDGPGYIDNRTTNVS